MRNFLEYLGLILTALMILGVIKSCVDEEQQIHDCYIQEPKTKECEYILWKEELDDNTWVFYNVGKNMVGCARYYCWRPYCVMFNYVHY